MVALSHDRRWAEGEAVLRMESGGGGQGGDWMCLAQTGLGGGEGEVGSGRGSMAVKLWTPDSERTAICMELVHALSPP